MRARIVLCALALAAATASRSAHAREIVPRAWAGVWSVRDTTYNFGVIVQISTRLDTLCTGEVFVSVFPGSAFPPPTSSPTMNCGGVGFTDDSLNTTCFVTIGSVQYSSDQRWTRSADQA